MIYNVDYEIAALIFVLLFFSFHRNKYAIKSRKNMIFQVMLTTLFFGTVFDSLTAYTISYSATTPRVINYILNAIFFALTPLCSMLLTEYCAESFDVVSDFKPMLKVNHIVMYVYAALCFSSPFTHLMFYFDEANRYCHGLLYMAVNILPGVFVLEALVISFKERKGPHKDYFKFILGFVLLTEAGVVLQVTVAGNTLISFFAASVGVMLLLITMETPDYMKLVETLEDLEAAEKDAETARLEAENANKAKSRFLANMSHEIRTPINGILGINEIAISENSDEQIQQYLLDIKDASQTLLAVVNDVLDFSKIEAGKMELAPCEYKISNIMLAINNLMEFKAHEKQLDLYITNNPSIPSVLLGDELRIRQIIINLVNNGIKYTEQGSVTLNLDYEQGTGREIILIITVKDTGIGIKDEDKDYIFKSFSRVDESLNRHIEGTGLGLALVSQLVSLMNGTVSVDSLYGFGSTFTVRIPQEVVAISPMGDVSLKSSAIKADLRADRTTTPDETGEFKAEGRRVLVVDDVPMNLKVFSGLLKNSGLIIDEAESGAEALLLTEQNKYDCIFLDQMMPQMDGVETLQNIKTQIGAPNNVTPVICLTANAVDGAREEYLASGFSDYMAKPFNKKQLIKMLITYL